MNRRTLTAAIAFAVLGIIAIFAVRAPEKGERASDRPRPFVKIAAAELDTLEVTRGGVTTTIKREAGKFKVTAPVAYAADEPTAKAAFEALENLDLNDLVTEQKTKHAEFEVEDGKAVRVVARSSKGDGKANKVLADLLIGKSTGTGTMLRPSGKDEVWQASGSVRYSFDKQPADWRDKTITTFTAADAEKIDVKTKDGASIALKKSGAKEGAEDKWEITTSSVKIAKLDNTVPNGIVQALATFKANDFGDGAKLEEAGLAPPLLTVTVGLKDNKTVTALIGGKKGDEDYYVKTPEGAQVYLVKKYAIERVNKRPIEFQDKTLCDMIEADIAEVAVTNSDKSYTMVNTSAGWKLTRPAKLDGDAGKLNPIASALKDWKAQGFAEDSAPKATGLAKPKATIAVKHKQGGVAAGCLVKVGDETKDKQSYHAQTAKGGADVYVVPKWAIDRFLVKPDDLKKGAGPAAAPNPHGMPNPHARN